MTLDIAAIRSGFPALSRTVAGAPAAYLDGPGGTQVHQTVIDAMAGFMEIGGSNTHGPFASSQASQDTVDAARSAVADLFGASPDEIVFGQNMTSLTYAMSRALARTWADSANIIVTRLDHDANVAPWLQAAESVGAEVRWIDIDESEGGNLDLDSLAAALDNQTALVALTHASNATGTIPSITAVIDMAHRVGALTYLDAVHYAPHGLIDVKATGTDFLVSSVYKWFGPHTACLYGKRELLQDVAPYKLRPSPDTAPDRWETGTQSFESLAGVAAAVDYIASLGRGPNRREKIVDAYQNIATYEDALSNRFLAGIAEMPTVTLVGQPTSEGRTPTFAIEIAGHTPDAVAATLGAEGIFVWSGDYYAYEVMRRLDKTDGMVRVGFVHYNTVEEVDRVLAALQDLG